MESSDYDHAKMSMEKAAPVTSQGQGLQCPWPAERPRIPTFSLYITPLNQLVWASINGSYLLPVALGFSSIRYTFIPPRPLDKTPWLMIYM
jgi:hypothetical protein